MRRFFATSDSVDSPDDLLSLELFVQATHQLTFSDHYEINVLDDNDKLVTVIRNDPAIPI